MSPALKDDFPSAPSLREISEFCDAAKEGQAAIVTELLDKFGVTIINTRDSIDARAITWAAWAGHVDMVELLITRGAAIDAPGTYDRTALGWAVDMGRTEVIQLLLARGARTDVKDENGDTPADLARRQGKHDLAETIESFAEKKRLAEAEAEEERLRNAAAGNLDKLRRAHQAKPGAWKLPPKPKN